MAEYALPIETVAAQAAERASPEEAASAADGKGAVAAPATGDAPTADALGDGPLAPKPGVPHRAINALLPFGSIAVVTFLGMTLDGAVKLRVKRPEAALSLIALLGESDSIAALIWASTVGWLTSMGLTISQGVLDLTECMEAWLEGMKDVLAPIMVLLLAWALGDVIGEAQAADFLARSLHSSLPRWALPSLICMLAHLISYACGSSFGTMGIILPLVGPLATKLAPGNEPFLRHCVGAVLGGATFGNLCSPISDTTVLTVLATKCDLHAHIATITPYTLLIASLALGLGHLPVGLGWYGPATALALCTAALIGIVLGAGTTPPTCDSPDAAVRAPLAAAVGGQRLEASQPVADETVAPAA